MKALEVSRLKFASPSPVIDEVSERLDLLGNRQKIDMVNWAGFDYCPEARFVIAHTGKEILLKYYVTESNFRAEKTKTNENVYEDSCVEFFVSPAGDGIYYNFEFNGLGTCLMGCGTSRSNSQRADPAIISKIRRRSSVGTQPYESINSFSWELTIAIPNEVFFRHIIADTRGHSFRANFYKCGDKLAVPHYVTWNKVETLVPDFHQPLHFGTLIFQ
jgi:hypothetical protein